MLASVRQASDQLAVVWQETRRGCAIGVQKREPAAAFVVDGRVELKVQLVCG